MAVSNNKLGSKKLDSKAIIQIHQILTPICHVIDDGYCKYEPGWSDERVAEEYKKLPGAMVQVAGRNHVSHLRLNMFGKLKDPTGMRNLPDSVALNQRITALEASRATSEKLHADLVQEVVELIVKFAALRDLLNQVVEWATANPASAPMYRK